jgi:hypothetical protein
MSKVYVFVICGAALAGCTASGDLMKTATPTVPLQFESEPAGAEVKTSGGQTCRTPCALAVPAADMQVTYSLNGYQPQTVAVKLVPPEEIRGGDDSGVTMTQPHFDPSPVMAELVKAGPTRRPAKKTPVAKRRAPAAAAVEEQQPEPGDGGGAPAPSTSGFNPPPTSNGGFTQPAPQRPAPAPSGGWPAPR